VIGVPPVPLQPKTDRLVHGLGPVAKAAPPWMGFFPME
jgi:hypothetical protein